MVFVVDDLIISAIIAAIGSTAAGVGLLSATKAGSLKTLKDSSGKTVHQYKLDGKLGFDPENTVGHTVDGYPVNSAGVRIVTDGSVFDRMNMSSYDILAMSNAVSGVTDSILGGVNTNSIFNLKYPRGSGSRRVEMVKNKLKKDPSWLKSIVESSFGSGSGFEDWDPKEIVKTFGNRSDELAALISGSASAQKKLLDQLKSYDPTYNIPRIIEGKGKGLPNEAAMPILPEGTDRGTGQAVGDMSGDIVLPGAQGGRLLPGLDGTIPVETPLSGPQGGVKFSPGGPTETKTGDPKPVPIPIPEVPKVPPKVPEKPKDPKEKEKEKEPKPPRFPDKPEKEPRQDDSEIVETPIKPANKISKKGVPWYPTYNMGGQDILKITDLEKLQELKNWSLFDLVSPLLQGDPENLLSIQQDIVQNMRFTNTYENPKPPTPLPPLPDTSAWAYPMRDIYPTPYPMRLINPQGMKLYYDNWGDQSNQNLNQKINILSGVNEPDIAQIVNAQSKGFTAIDPQYAKKGANAKFSLCEDVDTSSVDSVDLFLLMQAR